MNSYAEIIAGELQASGWITNQTRVVENGEVHWNTKYGIGQATPSPLVDGCQRRLKSDFLSIQETLDLN